MSKVNASAPRMTGVNLVTGWNGVWLIALGAALWGTDSVLRQPLLSYLSATQIVLLEHLLLAVYAIPVLWINRKQLRGLSLKEWGAILFISWGGSALATVLFTAAFGLGNASVVLLLQKLQPVFVFLLARVVLGERLTRGFGWYVLIALAGTYLLTFGFAMPYGNQGANEMLASVFAIGAAVLWGGSTVMGRLLLNKMSFETVTGARFLFALPLLALLVALNGTEGVNHISMWSNFGTLLVFGMILLQALLPGLISLLLYYRGLSKTPASYATLAELAFPAAGLTLNWLFLKQGFTLGQFIGFAVVWVVVFQIARLQDRR
nr:DMT family transporter [Tumebacillus amylolyticus]